jgi:hypothetical protein
MKLEIMKETVEKLQRLASIAEGMYTKQEFCKVYGVPIEELEEWPFFKYLPTCENFIPPRRQTLKAAGVDFFQ